ncbi:class I SAM-dependent DNA methyltransferase [Akkermansia muciniphila]|uniref:class I SAM-dependent DNA methyltransferase n=1 Tax=Akkermansia muciniphila TaxID=239935 RepID=UPI0018D77C30|nr:class I SAM-dependent DNA methyltransferase [Akkermansia muciniphila]
MQQQGVECDFTGSDSWVILSPIEQSIKRKIEAVGVPLKDWDIQINYGIKTGYNDAFIISTEKRNEILANCKDADERKRTEELIRPILRGRDIKRYGYEWANLWIINTHNGIKGKLPRIDVNEYPAIKAHLDQFWDKISKRADKGDTPYNLRNCAYMEDFFKPKLFYADITQQLNFCICKDVMFCNNTTYFIASENELLLDYIQKYLNSPLIDWYYRTLSVQLGEKAVRMFSMYVLEIPIPPISKSDIYKSYGLSPSEVSFIENREG